MQILNTIDKYINEGMKADPIAGNFRDVTDGIGNKLDAIVKETKKYDSKLASKMDKYFNSYFKQMEKFELDAKWARKKMTNP